MKREKHMNQDRTYSKAFQENFVEQIFLLMNILQSVELALIFYGLNL